MKESMKNVELTYALDPAQIKALAKFQVELGLIKQEEYDKIDWASSAGKGRDAGFPL